MRQIRVNGDQSDWYEEALFTLKEGVTREGMPKNLTQHAEELLEKHMKLRGATSYFEPNKKQKIYKQMNGRSTVWIDFFFWGSITLLIVVSLIYVLL